MNSSNNELKTLLARWRDVEPSPGFETAVWRRIRQRIAEPAVKAGWGDLVPGWLTAQPAWAMVAVIVAGAIIGGWAGVAPLSRPGRGSEVALLRPGTLAGNYVSMTSGGAR